MNAIAQDEERNENEAKGANMTTLISEAARGKTYVVSLENRKKRGAGHERPAEILKAARELFLENGVANVTTRQIAARVGISQTALYVYFANKEQMLERLEEETWKALTETLDAVKSEPDPNDPAKPLKDMLVAFISFWLRRPDDHRIIFMRRALMGCASDDPLIARDFGRHLLDRLSQGIEKAAQAGAVRRVNCANTTALSIWAAVSGLVTLRLVYPNFPWPPEDKHIAMTLDMIFNGCAAAKAAAKI